MDRSLWLASGLGAFVADDPGLSLRFFTGTTPLEGSSGCSVCALDLSSPLTPASFHTQNLSLLSPGDLDQDMKRPPVGGFLTLGHICSTKHSYGPDTCLESSHFVLAPHVGFLCLLHLGFLAKLHFEHLLSFPTVPAP